MIKSALEYINGLKEPFFKEHEGYLYSDKALHRVKHIPLAAPIVLNTLSSFIQYVKSNPEDFKDKKMIVHVESPTSVRVYSQLNSERDRESLVQIQAKVPSFSFDRYIDHETFCISLQAKFIENEDRNLLLQFAGTVEDKSVTEYGDDGVTQKATIKSGIASKKEALVPNPVSLIPYRTFNEVNQPESRFIFRMRSERGVECAVFEADGGAWGICQKK